jgi:2'-5' RNA ligase
MSPAPAPTPRPARSPPAGAHPARPRLFLALWPDARVRRALAAWRDSFAWPAGAAPVVDARLHLTLHFIGEVDAAGLPMLARTLRVAVPRFELVLDRARDWHGGLVVLRPGAIPPPLTALHQALGDALRAAGLRPEARPFRPHVTLARHAAGAVAGRAPPAVRWRVAGYALVRSTPGPPLQYAPLWRQRAAAA